jgi:hypothetical protein
MCPAGETLTLLATSDLHGARVPESTVPESTVPESTVPESTVPESTSLVHADPGATTDATILVDNGDLFGGPSGLRFSLEGGVCGTIQWMTHVGLAALHVGHHDLDQGVEGLLERARQAVFPVLSANLYDGNERLLPDRAVVDTPAGRVGLAGALTPMARDMWPPSLRQRLRLTDPVAALRESCAALRPDCRYVIALAHLGFPIGSEPSVEALGENPGEALVEALALATGDGRPLADCVVLGHTHVPHASVRGRTAILAPPSGGRGFGRAVFSQASVSAELVATSSKPAADAREQAAVAPLLGRPLHTDAATLGAQILAAARPRGADGVVVTRRLEPHGPPVRTVAEALVRAPLLEPLVLLELDEAGLGEVLATRDRHAALADAAGDLHVARRHRWHAFELLADPRSAPGNHRPWRLLVPASWSGGYAGYNSFFKARVLAEPGLHLVELLLAASRRDDSEPDRGAQEHSKDGTRR